jgi:hypothetical protein
MTLSELLDVIRAAYDDTDLRPYRIVAGKRQEEVTYTVRGVWLDHENQQVILSLGSLGPRDKVKTD